MNKAKEFLVNVLIGAGIVIVWLLGAGLFILAILPIPLMIIRLAVTGSWFWLVGNVLYIGLLGGILFAIRMYKENKKIENISSQIWEDLK